MCLSSTLSDFRNFLLAGTLARRGPGRGNCSLSDRPSQEVLRWEDAAKSVWHPVSPLLPVLVFRVTRATAAIEASFRPWLVGLIATAGLQPLRQSCWWHGARSRALRRRGHTASVVNNLYMKLQPASLTITSTLDAPASTEFSIISLTTEAGLWTTSPAAIRSAMSPGSIILGFRHS